MVRISGLPSKIVTLVMTGTCYHDTYLTGVDRNTILSVYL